MEDSAEGSDESVTGASVPSSGASPAEGETGEALDLGERMILDYGLAMAAAELSWLDRSLEWLAQEGESVEITQAGIGSGT